MSFLVYEDPDQVAVHRHRAVRMGKGPGTSFRNKWNFARGSRAAVFKKIRAGGTHSRKELRRQMDYINKKTQYSFGYSEFLSDNGQVPELSLGSIADKWEAGWSGTPKNGHTSHLLMSFPPDTGAREAAKIAEECCEQAFGGARAFSDDRWEYIAALHTDREHPHVHIIVNNRGVENGTWFYLSGNPEAEFTYQGFRNLMVSVARQYGVELEATTRYERGDLQYSPNSAQWRREDQPGYRSITPRLDNLLLDEAEEWLAVENTARLVGDERVEAVAERVLQGIAAQNSISRVEMEMAMEDLHSVESFDQASTSWVQRVRDKVLELPPEDQGRHFTAIRNEVDQLNKDFGYQYPADDLEFTGRIAEGLRVDSELLKGRAQDYLPEDHHLSDQVMDRAVEVFSLGAVDGDDIKKLEGGQIEGRQLQELETALQAVAKANQDYSFEGKSDAISSFWKKIGSYADQAAINRDYVRDILENDTIGDKRKVDILADAVDPDRQPKISAEAMFAAIQDERREMRQNVVTPDTQYLGDFMRHLTEREYPTAAPEFSSERDAQEYAAALRAQFGKIGLEKIASGEYDALVSITPNKLHQRELAASVMAVAEQPQHAEKLGLSKEQIAHGYEAADEPHRAKRVLGRSLDDGFSL